MKIGIIDLCKQIEDPRMNRKKVHKMETIIYISIAAVICGAQSWNEIEEFGNAKIAFFKSRIPDLEFILGSSICLQRSIMPIFMLVYVLIYLIKIRKTIDIIK